MPFDPIPDALWKRLIWLDPARPPRIGATVLCVDRRKGFCIGTWRGRKIVEVSHGNVQVEEGKLSKRCREKYQAAANSS